YFYNNYDGIDLVFSSNNYLNNCWIYNNSYGIQLLESSNNHLTACHIYNNSYRGLYLTASINNTISSCSIYGNTHGIFLFSSSNNNTIYHNSFIKNIGHAYEYFCSINTWDNGYPSGGNYWDDYTGEDLYSGPNQDQPGSDWIGDTPYNISGGNNKDRYPLWYPTDQMPNRPPTANFTYSPASPVTTDTVKFTDTSYDPDGNIVAWLWDFGDGITSTLQNPTHKYADNGIYTVTLIVTDNDNATASVSKNITISNIAPKASFTYSPQNPTILDTIQFADLSTDSDGSIISWLWNFGDGNASTAQNPTHRYPLPGSYTVKLTVTDDDGANDTCTRTITVSAPNQPPTAYIDSISPNPAFYGDTVYFAGHGNDNDGCIAEYCWHSSLDGLLSTASSFNTSVLSVGTHTIYFKVKDNNGTWSEEVIEVLIVSMPNQPPIANAGPDQTVYKNDIVQFDASQSYDPDGTIVNYTWNFGDGSTGTGITATHAYLTKGVYTVTLTVTDNDGATGTDTCIITVLNKPPIADFAYSPTNPTTNGAIKFNDASTDPDGSIMSWLWEFGDGTNSTLQNPSHQYMDDGTYAVTLTVWDNDSESATIKKQIMIRNLLPIATFTYHQGIDVANNDTITLTLRVAGRKWHTVNMSVFEDNTIVGFVSVVREPGSPDERAENISITINSSKQYEILLEYSGLDSGANPVWVTVEYRGITETKHFVFNAPPGEDQNRTLDLDEILDEMIRAQGLVKFDASSSYDPDGFITNYTWNFGDGTAGYGMIVYHNYGDGNYTVTLTVKDNDGATNSKTATITIVIPKHPSPCPHPEIVIIHELKPGNNHINYTVATTTTKLSKGKR
ncbi:MAG: PKD domain-containing protein, partial [Candidatus Thermoplasmatota archaeon]